MKRYDLEDVGHYDDERSKAMLESEHGEWVKYEDHAAEVARLRSVVASFVNFAMNVPLADYAESPGTFGDFLKFYPEEPSEPAGKDATR